MTPLLKPMFPIQSNPNLNPKIQKPLEYCSHFHPGPFPPVVGGGLLEALVSVIPPVAPCLMERTIENPLKRHPGTKEICHTFPSLSLALSHFPYSFPVSFDPKCCCCFFSPSPGCAHTDRNPLVLCRGRCDGEKKSEMPKANKTNKGNWTPVKPSLLLHAPS